VREFERRGAAAVQERQSCLDTDLISTFNADTQAAIADALDTGPVLACPKGPYAACMTAPCKTKKKGGNPEGSCPVFWGAFQLTQQGVQCDLSDDLIWSSSFSPRLLQTEP
jgi:hypothetical protein